MRMPIRPTLSPYAGPMPRPVVPNLAFPRYRSLTRSSARWCGMIRCASAETTSREVSTPRSASADSSPSSTCGSTTTPLPITEVTPADRMPDGIRCSANLSPSGVTTVCPALLPPW